MANIDVKKNRRVPPRLGAGSRRSSGPERCRRKFLKYFPHGFHDETYLDWERDYKWKAHERWTEQLGERELRRLVAERAYDEVARRAVQIESRTNLLFSFEKMALRDGVKSMAGAKLFAESLLDFLHGNGSDPERFSRWTRAVGELPRRQTRVLTWPVVTVFGFIGAPERHIFVKPNVMRRAAEAYEYTVEYTSRPGWPTYASMLGLAERVRQDLRDLQPRDMIDIQSFLWVQGSDEY